MAYKPSQKNRRMRPLEGLNLTPMIDIVTNLMFFLMIFANVIPVVLIDAPLPKVAATAEEIKKAKDDSNKLELTLYVSAQSVRVESRGLATKTFPLEGGQLPLAAIHTFLVQVHRQRPQDREITLIPSDDVSYESLVAVMDISRELRSGDEGFQPVPPELSQKAERVQYNQLFPDVSLGGV